RSPEVPGFWSPNGVVLVVLIVITLEPEQVGIKVGVLLGTVLPRHVRLHAAPLHLAPDLGPAEQADGALDRLRQRLLAGRREDDARSDSGLDRRRICIDQRIGEAPDAADQRHAAVAQPVQLRQPAGLEARRDDHEVRTALYE